MASWPKQAAEACHGCEYSRGRIITVELVSPERSGTGTARDRRSEEDSLPFLRAPWQVQKPRAVFSACALSGKP